MNWMKLGDGVVLLRVVVSCQRVEGLGGRGGADPSYRGPPKSGENGGKGRV